MTLGEKLRGAREARNVSIDAIASSTGIARGNLDALERDAYNALPGRAKFYIRAYAKTLGFDPKGMIEEYDRELEAAQPDAPATGPERAAPRPVEAAIARWRKAAMAAHAKPEAPAQDDDFEDDDPDDEIIEADTPVAAAPPVRPPHSVVAANRGVDARFAAADLTPVDGPLLAAPAETPDPPGPVPMTMPPAFAQAEPEPPLPASAPPRSRARFAASMLFGVVVVLAGIRLIVFKTNADGGEPSAPSSVAAPAKTAAPVQAPVPAPPRASVEQPAPARHRADPPPALDEREAPAGDLTIAESGVGRRIVNRRVAGESGIFAPGDVALFQTHVQGGKRGQAIRHVWIHEGRVQQSIALNLGGPDWRTHSRKTLWAEGSWTVEARNAQGEVLASAAFECARPD